MHPWYHDAIFYHIYPLGAVTTMHENDGVLSTEGLDRLMDWIPHMRKLGCNAVYLGPVFESSSHGYDTTDYRKIDSRLGTEEQFTEFVDRCHRQGIRVVPDAVFNHTGREFFAFQELRKHREGSPYKDWYRGVNFGSNNPNNDGFSYEAWRGHWELPRLNPFHPPVVDYLLETALYWIDHYHIDGLRLDCADCLEPDFMKRLRQTCLGRKDDFWLMGEIIHGDYTRWANADTLHSVTNYEAGKGLYSSHNDGNMHEIAYTLNREFGSGGIYKQLYLYNFADNHDVDRIADKLKDKRHLPTVYSLLYTMPGLPSLYYGSEWGIGGVSDRVTDWNLRPFIDISTATFDDSKLMAHITNLARIRAQCPALRHGTYTQLTVSSHQLAFRREGDGEVVLVAVNIADKPAELTLQADGDWFDLLHPGEKLSGHGSLSVKIPPHSSRILRKTPLEAAEAPAQVVARVAAQTQPEPASKGRSRVKVRLKKSE